jgi:RNA polymerase sigma-70 factor (ECF subfamily)
LYREHAETLLRHVLVLTGGDHERAEEVVRETLLRAESHADRLTVPAASLRPWLMTIARRLAAGDDRPGRSPARQASPARMAQLLDTLDATQREALVETYFKGRTVSAAAIELGVTPEVLKSRLHEGMRSLGAALTGRESAR